MILYLDKRRTLISRVAWQAVPGLRILWHRHYLIWKATVLFQWAKEARNIIELRVFMVRASKFDTFDTFDTFVADSLRADVMEEAIHSTPPYDLFLAHYSTYLDLTHENGSTYILFQVTSTSRVTVAVLLLNGTEAIRTTQPSLKKQTSFDWHFRRWITTRLLSSLVITGMLTEEVTVALTKYYWKCRYISTNATLTWANATPPRIHSQTLVGTFMICSTRTNTTYYIRC